MDVYPKLKVAAVQASPIFLDREGTVEKSCELIREAGSKGAKIIVFPESYIPTHPLWYAFVRSEESMKYYRELFKNAVEIPSDATAKLCAAAKDADSIVVMGMNEKNPGTLGTLYNTQLFIDRTKIFPIMHGLAIKNEILERSPWVAQSIMQALERSKKIAYETRDKLAPQNGSINIWNDGLRDQYEVFGESAVSAQAGLQDCDPCHRDLRHPVVRTNR